MSATDRWVASITLKDGIDRESVVSIYVSATDGKAYMNAAQGGTRDATKVGVFFAKTLAVTDCVPVKQEVSLLQIEDSITLPSEDTMRGNKLLFQYRGGGSNFDFSVPGREPGAFTQGTNSLNVDITSPTAMSEFVAAFNDVGKTKYGSAATIYAAKVND